MKKILFISVLNILLASSCSITNNTTGSSDTCLVTYKKYKSYFSKPLPFRWNDTLSVETLLACTIEQANKGNKKAKKYLFGYYNKLKKYYQTNNLEISYIANEFESYQASILSQMRGKKAFELALEFASDSILLPMNDTAGGGHLGLRVIETVIYPMIKSVGAYPDLYDYLTADNRKNQSYNHEGQEIEELSERIYQFYLFEIKKAYSEGKIILKKYGE